MKAKGIFISTLLVVDTFLMSYAAGFHSRHVLVVNPKLPTVVEKKVEAKPAPVSTPAKKTDAKDGHVKHASKGSHSAKTHGNGSHDTKAGEKPADSRSGAKPAAKTYSTTAAKQAAKAETKPTAKPAAKPAAKPQAKPQATRDKSIPKQIKTNPSNPGA